MSVAAVAEELGTSPQNLNAKFNRKSIKIDFFQKIKEIIDKCAPPLPWLLRINCCENRMSSCKVKLKPCLPLSGKNNLVTLQHNVDRKIRLVLR